MAIVSIKDFMQVDPNTVATPDWTHLDVSSVKNVFIPHNMIHIDDETGNLQKVETHTTQEIEILRMSFASGVDTSQFPGAVKFRGNNQEDLALWLAGKLTNAELQLKTGMKKPFVLVYGFGRHESQVELGQTQWVYTLLDGTQDQMEDVQAAENEGFPQRLNREPDMRLHLSRKIQNGRIANTEDAITKEFKRIYSRRDASTRGRVVQAVMAECNTPQPIRTFTSGARINQWIDNHASKAYVVGGALDEDRETYGVSIGPGYLYRVVAQAARRYRKTGRSTYVIAHVGTPTKTQSIHEKRAKMLEELEELERDFQACGMTNFPVYIMGFLPQIRSEEDVKKLVPTGTPRTHRAKDNA